MSMSLSMPGVGVHDRVHVQSIFESHEHEQEHEHKNVHVHENETVCMNTNTNMNINFCFRNLIGFVRYWNRFNYRHRVWSDIRIRNFLSDKNFFRYGIAKIISAGC
jgi:hypothetical protein